MDMWSITDSQILLFSIRDNLLYNKVKSWFKIDFNLSYSSSKEDTLSNSDNIIDFLDIFKYFNS